jgi:23S rRNA (guanosine2251-2'-O)-methyltransferase
MPSSSYQIRQCLNPECGLRYPQVDGQGHGQLCPSCRSKTRQILERPLTPEKTAKLEVQAAVDEIQLSALLDNIRSAWNVGAMFRTADGLGLQHLYLCGITATPEHKAVRKTSLGAEASVDWTRSPNAIETAQKLKQDGYKLIALEQDPRSIPLKNIERTDSSLCKAVLIVGNEVTGVDPELLDLSDWIVHIPMYGQKRSFNVEVAFGIATYALLRGE